MLDPGKYNALQYSHLLLRALTTGLRVLRCSILRDE